jgi:hypothetical protein
VTELVFDTNVWRALPEGRKSRGWWRRNMRRLAGAGHTVHASIVNIVELGSHVYQIPPRELRRYREAFRLIEETSEGRVLPDPESEIEIAFGVAPLQPVDAAGLRQLVGIAARAPSPQAIRDGFNCTLGPGGVLVRARAGEQSLADFRAQAQDAFVQDVIDHVIDALNPGSLAALRAGNRANVEDRTIRRNLLGLISGPTARGQVAAALRAKARVGLLNGGAQRLTAHQGVPPSLDAYAAYYVMALRQVVETGYDPVRRRNDFWDWQLLTHLQPGRILVTNDGNLRGRVAASTQAAQIISLDQIGQL